MSNSEEEKREMRCASAGSLEDLQEDKCIVDSAGDDSDSDEDEEEEEEKSEQRMMNVMADFRQ